MSICVTGSAGFIGSTLAESLLKDGVAVVGIDNFNDYYDPSRKRKNTESLKAYPNFTSVELDVRDRDGVFSTLKKYQPKSIAHLAGMAGVRNSVEHPDLYFAVNVMGSQNLMDAAREVGVKNFVFASTSSIYGDTSEIPFCETSPCVTVPQPYAASKRSIELLGYTYHKLYGLSFTAVRFFTVYGPKGRPDMMPYLLADSISSGRKIPFYGEDMKRDWTFVDDIVAGLKKAIATPLGYEIINLGRGAPVSLGEFIATMESIAGKRANLELRPKPKGDVYITFANITKAQKLLGYEPQVSVREGIESFWQWYEREVLK